MLLPTSEHCQAQTMQHTPVENLDASWCAIVERVMNAQRNSSTAYIARGVPIKAGSAWNRAAKEAIARWGVPSWVMDYAGDFRLSLRVGMSTSPKPRNVST